MNISNAIVPVKILRDYLLLRRPRIVSAGASKLFFQNSRQFHNKMKYRMAHDQNPKFIIFADKLATRDYVQAKIGAEYLPKLYFAGQKLDLESFKKLPDNVVIKVNHLSGGILLRHLDAPPPAKKIQFNKSSTRVLLPPSAISYADVKVMTDKWLSQRYETNLGSAFEWGYSQIAPRIFAEEFIDSDYGSMATDYKFFVFGSLCPYFLIVEKKDGKSVKKIYDSLGLRLKAFRGETFPDGESISISPTITSMLEIAVKLGDNIDHLRVDFFLRGSRIYVGELTPYDSGGVNVCTNEFERFAGNFWSPSWK